MILIKYFTNVCTISRTKGITSVELQPRCTSRTKSLFSLTTKMYLENQVSFFTYNHDVPREPSLFFHLQPRCTSRTKSLFPLTTKMYLENQVSFSTYNQDVLREPSLFFYLQPRCIADRDIKITSHQLKTGIEKNFF